MAGNFAVASPMSRLDRIAAQMARIEQRSVEWDNDPAPLRGRGVSDRAARRRQGEAGRVSGPSSASAGHGGASLWASGENRVKLSYWDGFIRELAEEMARKTKDPFSGRTRQISVLCAFIPFVCSILGAGIRFMPQMPYLSLWQKTTFFIVFPIFLAVAGAFVGFLIGVMLDTLERQQEHKEVSRSRLSPMDEEGPADLGVTRKQSVWINTDDLEENQRVAETVTGPDGTPILLRHTLLKPSHIQMLKDRGVDRIRVEEMTEQPGGDLAFAG